MPVVLEDPKSAVSSIFLSIADELHRVVEKAT
jgi:hypothetical protein